MRQITMRGFALYTVALLLATSASALTDSEIKCQDAIAKAGRTYFKSRLKTVGNCENDRADGTLPPSADCRPLRCSGGDNDGLACGNDLDCPLGTCIANVSVEEKVSSKLAGAADKVEKKIGAKCTDPIPAAVVLGLPCGTTATLAVADVAACLTDRAHGANAERLITTAYDATGALTGTVLTCQEAIGKESRNYASKRLLRRRNCARKLAAGKITRPVSGRQDAPSPRQGSGQVPRQGARRVHGGGRHRPEQGLRLPLRAQRHDHLRQPDLRPLRRHPHRRHQSRPLPRRRRRRRRRRRCRDRLPDARRSAVRRWRRRRRRHRHRLHRLDSRHRRRPGDARGGQRSGLRHHRRHPDRTHPGRRRRRHREDRSERPHRRHRSTTTASPRARRRAARAASAPPRQPQLPGPCAWCGPATRTPSSNPTPFSTGCPPTTRISSSTSATPSTATTTAAAAASPSPAATTTASTGRTAPTSRCATRWRPFGTVSIWDDHEVTNDFYGTDPSPGFQAQMTDGNQAYRDYLPVREDGGDPMQLYRSFQWGQAAEFFLIDDRQYRSAPAYVTEPACLSAGEPAVLPPAGACATEIANPAPHLSGRDAEAVAQGRPAQLDGEVQIRDERPPDHQPPVPALRPLGGLRRRAAGDHRLHQDQRHQERDLPVDRHPRPDRQRPGRPPATPPIIRELVSGAIGMDSIYRELPATVAALVPTLPALFTTITTSTSTASTTASST